jgi:hypothetical protein
MGHMSVGILAGLLALGGLAWGGSGAAENRPAPKAPGLDPQIRAKGEYQLGRITAEEFRTRMKALGVSESYIDEFIKHEEPKRAERVERERCEKEHPAPPIERVINRHRPEQEYRQGKITEEEFRAQMRALCVSESDLNRTVKSIEPERAKQVERERCEKEHPEVKMSRPDDRVSAEVQYRGGKITEEEFRTRMEAQCVPQSQISYFIKHEEAERARRIEGERFEKEHPSSLARWIDEATGKIFYRPSAWRSNPQAPEYWYTCTRAGESQLRPPGSPPLRRAPQTAEERFKREYPKILTRWKDKESGEIFHTAQGVGSDPLTSISFYTCVLVGESKVRPPAPHP